MTEPNTFIWNELVTPDQASAGPFYSTLFGWERHEVDAGLLGTYTLFRPPRWIGYIAVADERGLRVEAWAEGRRRYLDNLKVLLVAGIIAGHGIAGYADGALWPYAEIRETTLADATTIGLLALVGPFALFMIPLLFLVAGLLTPGSLERKGPGRYARDRLLRLGGPFAVLESTVTVVGPVWLLAVAQRYLDQPLRWARPAVSRSAYGAFLVQGYVLIGLAVALRPLPLAAEFKALLVAGGSVAGSFALAWLLIKRVPGVRRVL